MSAFTTLKRTKIHTPAQFTLSTYTLIMNLPVCNSNVNVNSAVRSSRTISDSFCTLQRETVRNDWRLRLLLIITSGSSIFWCSFFACYYGKAIREPLVSLIGLFLYTNMYLAVLVYLVGTNDLIKCAWNVMKTRGGRYEQNYTSYY